MKSRCKDRSLEAVEIVTTNELLVRNTIQYNCSLYNAHKPYLTSDLAQLRRQQTAKEMPDIEYICRALHVTPTLHPNSAKFRYITPTVPSEDVRVSNGKKAKAKLH